MFVLIDSLSLNLWDVFEYLPNNYPAFDGYKYVVCKAPKDGKKGVVYRYEDGRKIFKYLIPCQVSLIGRMELKLN